MVFLVRLLMYNIKLQFLNLQIHVDVFIKYLVV